jgi:MYXO-CTERM domain-containing protein
MHKKIAAVGLAALLTVGTSASTFAQQQQPGTATQAPTSQQANQSRNDNDFPWGLLGLLGLAGLAGLKRRDHEVRRDERMPTGTPVGTHSRMS